MTKAILIFISFLLIVTFSSGAQDEKAYQLEIKEAANNFINTLDPLQKKGLTFF